MNRCLTEGRKAFLERVAGIEAGGECERLLDLPARVSEALVGWAQKGQAATEMATAQKVAAVAASTAVIGGGAEEFAP